MWRRSLVRAHFSVRGILLVAVLALAALAMSWSSPIGRPAAAAMPEAPDTASALLAAQLQGSRVESVELRTPTRTVMANPDGTLTAELSVVPTRVKHGDAWVPLDTVMSPRAGGVVGPRAAVGDLALSGGGSKTALARLTKDGKSFALYWPGTLPSPRLDGDAATYPEVLPGVDLILRATARGYQQQLVIKSAEAARNPALAEIRFRVETTAVRLTVEKSGVVQAVDEAGELIFAAPPSVMWDSSGPASSGPATGRSAPVGVELRGDALVLRPDPVFLADPTVKFPVTVDPNMQTADKSNWATVLSGPNFHGQPYWWTSGDAPWAQVGQCYRGSPDLCNGIGAARAYFQFDTGFLTGRRIIGSEFKSVVVYSPSCNVRTHQLYRTDGQINPGTTWDNAPGGVTGTDYAAPVVYSNCGGDKPVGAGTINTGGLTTYFMKAADEGDMLAWRKYDPGATKLSVTYNTGPNQPSLLPTDPPAPAPCRWCGGTPYIGDDSIRLRATLSDPDGDLVKPKWIINANEVPEERWGVLQVSGATHDTIVDLRNRHDQRIRWQVQTWDTRNGDNNTCSAGDTTGCLDASTWAFGPTAFVVDRVGVAVPPTVSGVLYREDNRWHGAAGVPDTFTFGANGVGDIDHYLWGWSDPPTNQVDAATHLSDNATLQLTPPGDGPRDLFVQSIDRAGHRSPTRVYHFFVRPGTGALAQWSFDGNAKDSAYLGDRNGTVNGAASYSPGVTGSAIQLSNNASVSAPNAVRTDASFSVAAWVRPDQLVTGTHMTAVSQSGTSNSGFELQYNSGHQRWVFIMATTDTESTSWGAAVSSQQPVVGQWTHIAGVYDAAAQQLRIYVNGQLTGSQAWSSTWNAAGPLVIGHGEWRGGPDSWWPGAIDEVQLYDRVVSEIELKAMVARDDVKAGYWQFDDEQTISGQPNTNARNSADEVNPGSLVNGATLTGQGAIKGAVQCDGLDDAVVTRAPAVRTDQSFSVAAWVKADRLGTSHMTAVSQPGTRRSGFSLQYNGGHQKWLFLFSNTDDDNSGWTGAVASQPPVTGQWVHLAGVYDASAQQIRVYVNGQLGGTNSWTAPWNAGGPLTIGRGFFQGGPREHWAGGVDEVRMYGRALSEAELRAIVSQDNITAGTWKLDGDANDSSGRGLTGTLNGAPAFTAGQSTMADPADRAVQLNGSSQYVSTPNAVDPTKSFSVAAWARLDRLNQTAAVVSQDAGRISVFNLHNAWDGRWVFALRGCDASWNCTETRAVGTQAQAAVWVHLVGTYDAVRGQLAIFVNGVLAGTTQYTQTWNDQPGPMLIGRATWGNANPADYFPGAIDDVTVYNRPLFSDEVRALAGRDLNLVHHWRLDETTGTAADSIGARAATPAGGATFGPGRVGNSIQLNGTAGVVATAGVDLRTDQSFTVATWVYLNTTGRSATALSVDGARTSKFRLGVLVDDDQAPRGKWIFEMPESDTDAAPVAEAALSVESSEVGKWVHLVGVYDAQTKKIWLYVNGDRVDDGTVNTPWQATGGLQIGRGKVAGQATDFWNGNVDDVRMYTGPLDRDRISTLYRSYPAIS